MFDKDKWQEIFMTMGRNKLRTVLTAFSVAWGIFILIVLLAAGQGLRNGAASQFASDAVNSLWIDGGQTSMPYAGYKPGRRIQLHNSDLYHVKQNVAGVDVASAVYHGWESKVLSYKNEHAAFTVRSCAPGHNLLEKAVLVEGRFINEIDFNEFRKVCVMGLPVKRTLFKGEDPLHKYIDVAGSKYQVVGVFNDPGRGDNDRIYIPLLTAQRIGNGKDEVDVVWAGTGTVSVEQSKEMVSSIRDHLSKKYHFDPKDPNAINIYNNNVTFKRIMGMLDGIKIFIYVIGLLTLIAGIVGVSNIMMIVVKERTREIGIRKALGATPFSIVALILQESIFVTFIAGYVGLLGGLGIVELVKSFHIDSEFFKDPDVDITIALSALGMIILSGALAGLFPALKAARVEPISALREE